MSFWNLWSSKHSIDGLFGVSMMRALHPHRPKRRLPMRYAPVIFASVLGIGAVGIGAGAIASEQPHTTLGVLTCTLLKPAQDEGHKMTCGFKPTGTGAEEKYGGTIQQSAQDLPPGKVVLIWLVLGPADEKLRGGILAQRYLRGVAEPGQPPVLTGETDPRIALQFETNDGVASYDTITQIELALTQTPA